MRRRPVAVHAKVAEHPRASHTRSVGAVGSIAPAIARETCIILIRQHAELRELIAALRPLLEELRVGQGSRVVLKAKTLRFVEVLDAHNHSEESLLEGLRGVCDGGRVTEVINRGHFEQHRAIRAVLLDICGRGSDAWVAKRMGAALDHVIVHMVEEEAWFCRSSHSRETEETAPR